MQPYVNLPCSKGSLLAYKKAHGKGVEVSFLVEEREQEKDLKAGHFREGKKMERGHLGRARKREEVWKLAIFGWLLEG